MGAIFNWLQRYIPEDPLRKVANVRQQNRIANILEDISGVGCRIDKPTERDGYGWRIVVDGTSDVSPASGTVFPAAAASKPRPFDVVFSTEDNVKVRGGYVIYVHLDGNETYIPLADGATGTIWNPSDLTAEIAAGSFVDYIYIKIDKSDATPANWTATAIASGSDPAAIDGADDYVYILIAIGDVLGTKSQSDITQLWTGGNIVLGSVSFPMVNQLLAADGATDILPDTHNAYTFAIGSTGTRWSGISSFATGAIAFDSSSVGAGAITLTANAHANSTIALTTSTLDLDGVTDIKAPNASNGLSQSWTVAAGDQVTISGGLITAITPA